MSLSTAVTREIGTLRHLIVDGTSSTIYLSPGSGKRWKLIYGYIYTKTSSTVATRRYGVVLDGPGDIDFVTLVTYDQAESLTRRVSLGAAVADPRAVAIFAPDYPVSLHGDTYLEGTDRLSLQVQSNGKSDDVTFIHATVLEYPI